MIEILRNSKKIIWFRNKIQRSSHTSTKHTILFLFTHNATHSVRLIFVSLLEMLCVMLCVNLSEIAVCCALCELIRNTVWAYQKCCVWCCVWVYWKCYGTEEDDLHNYFNPLLTKLQGWKGYQNVWSKPENLNFWFPVQPHGYRGARVQKHRKKSRKLSKTPKFSMFFVSSSSKIRWSC